MALVTEATKNTEFVGDGRSSSPDRHHLTASRAIADPEDEAWQLASRDDASCDLSRGPQVEGGSLGCEIGHVRR